jgi:hypothetical protein
MVEYYLKVTSWYNTQKSACQVTVFCQLKIKLVELFNGQNGNDDNFFIIFNEMVSILCTGDMFLCSISVNYSRLCLRALSLKIVRIINYDRDVISLFN